MNTVTSSASSGDPYGIQALSADALEMVTQTITDNMDAIILLLTFWLAVRFGPALLSWFRHRNDPKQMSDV